MDYKKAMLLKTMVLLIAFITILTFANNNTMVYCSGETGLSGYTDTELRRELGRRQKHWSIQKIKKRFNSGGIDFYGITIRNFGEDMVEIINGDYCYQAAKSEIKIIMEVITE